MAERETATGPQSEPSALGWAGRWLQSDLLPRTPAGEPATRSMGAGASTGVNTTDLSVTPVRFAGYEIIEKIGQGGMGSVYRVRNPELDRFEALKLIAPRNSDDSAVRTRFAREYQLLGKLEHPNVVPVYDAGVWEGLPYFTMKYVPGGTLGKHLDRFRMDPTAAARLMAKVARAVDRLHQAGVLHRDLKPHNILIGDGDEPLVADFGLVKKLGEDSDASMTGAPMGTRQYMSPEQTFAHRADYTPACDVWAVGVILYELLAGRRPFPSTDPVEVYIQIRAANPTPILESNPDAPAPLAAVAHRCLAKAPADRYPTAAAVADDLEAWLAGEAITATCPPAGRRPRRRWPAWAAGGVVTAAAVIAVVVALSDPPPGPDANPFAAPVPPGLPPAPAPVPAPPEPVKSAAERLRAGEMVRLIGDTWPPDRPTRELPGNAGTFGAGPGNVPVFTSFTFGVIELLNDQLPLPFAVTAEVAIRWADPAAPTTCWAGVYAGGAAWSADGRPLHGLPAAVVFSKRPERDGDTLRVKYSGTLELLWWEGDQPFAYETVRDLGDIEFPRPVGVPFEPDWHQLRIEVRPGAIGAAAFGRQTKTADWVWEVVRSGRLAFRPAPRNIANPQIPATPGTGVGLVVRGAELRVRNVQLVPLTP